MEIDAAADEKWNRLISPMHLFGYQKRITLHCWTLTKIRQQIGFEGSHHFFVGFSNCAIFTPTEPWLLSIKRTVLCWLHSWFFVASSNTSACFLSIPCDIEMCHGQKLVESKNCFYYLNIWLLKCEFSIRFANVPKEKIKYRSTTILCFSYLNLKWKETKTFSKQTKFISAQTIQMHSSTNKVANEKNSWIKLNEIKEMLLFAVQNFWKCTM